MLTKEKILEKLEEREPIFDQLEAEHKKLLMHVHGVGVSEYITEIEGLENPDKIKIRKKLSRSNRDLFADILRPTDKIFNSQGGSKVYQLPENKKTEFTEKLGNLNDGQGLVSWLETYFIDKMVIDPNGIFLIEHEDGIPYPTYKSICSIAYYEQKGRWVTDIIFEPELEEDGYRYVRVYDETGDYTYRYTEGNLELKQEAEINEIEDAYYPNPWGFVPAITCSNITNTLTDLKKSTIYEQIEIADEYLRETSIKTIFKYHHGFPLFWMYMSSCPVCKGMGFVNRINNGEESQHVCGACNGTGWGIKKDVSDVKLIKPPSTNEEPRLTPDIAGYVVPPVESWRQMSEELKLLRDMIYFSHWGTIINRDDVDKTAFEVALNTQPMQDRLNKYTNSLEDTEQKLTDIIGQYFYNETYKGCSINYGRNYIIKSPNQYLDEYLDEKTKGAGYTVLNDKLTMYYNALFANDDYSRICAIKLIYVEPWVHDTLEKVITWNIPFEELKRKLYYNDWFSLKTKDEIFKTDIKELQADLLTFTKLKNDTTTVQ